MKKQKVMSNRSIKSNSRNHSPKFAITTLGCKVNQYESDAIAQQLEDMDYVPADAESQADLCIINTCTVTQKASMQSRQAVRRFIRANPQAQIVVTGCYAQTEPDELKKIEGVHHIIGHGDKHNIPHIVLSQDKNLSSSSMISTNILNERLFKQIPVTAFGNRTRPFLKIQDGCDTFCTYCIVPYARGRSRSMPVENVLKNIRCLKQDGFHEVVLTGVHLGAYGLDLSPPTSLTSLLEHIRESNTMDRVRLSSIEPHELTQNIIKYVKDTDMFCPHFHIPMQSGDDRILERMHRPYTGSIFENLIIRINNQVPDAAIGVDILIGFPGETEKAFENTYSLIEKLPVTYLHVFPFSSRPGTPAARYPQKVPQKTIKARCEKMRRLGHIKKQVFYKKFLGKTVEILIEGKKDKATGLLKGITSNYIPIHVVGNDELFNTMIQVNIDKIEKNNMVFGVQR
jgi:threonylcarbamoyladenosine tRNA methylthiotransferase MtaB